MENNYNEVKLSVQRLSIIEMKLEEAVKNVRDEKEKVEHQLSELTPPEDNF